MNTLNNYSNYKKVFFSLYLFKIRTAELSISLVTMLPVCAPARKNPVYAYIVRLRKILEIPDKMTGDSYSW